MLSRESKLRIRHFLRRLGPPLAFALTISFIAFALVSYAMNASGQKQELETLSRFFAVRGPRPAPSNVVLAVIDDKTLSDLRGKVTPREKFPRIYSATALAKINSAQPKVVILDVKIPEEKDSPEADAIFERELREHRVSIWSGEIPQSGAELLGTDKFISVTNPSDERFVKAAKMSLRMWTSSSFGVRYELALTKNRMSSVSDQFVLIKPLTELAKLPTYTPGVYDFINFYGPKNTINRVSLSSILAMDQATLMNSFKDKVVLFGFQSVDQGLGGISDKDEYPVSVSDSTMFGVEIHANIAGNLLDGSFIKRASPQDESLYLFLVLLCMSAVGIKLSPEKTVSLIFSFAVLYTIVAYQLFSHFNVWLCGVFAVWIASFLICIASAFWHYWYLKKLSKVWDGMFDFELEGVER